MTLIIPAGSFLSKVVSFFLGPWGKLVGILLLCGALAYGFRLWLNRHDDRVYAGAMESTKKKLEAQYISQWQKSMTDAKNMYDRGTAALDAAAELNRRVDMKFATIFTSLSQIRQAVEDRKVIYVKEAAAVPESELDDALRTLSGVIAAQTPHH